MGEILFAQPLGKFRFAPAPPVLGGDPLRPRPFSRGPSAKSGKCDPRSKTVTICGPNGAEFRENRKKRLANMGKQSSSGARSPLSRFVSWSPAKRARAKRGLSPRARAKRKFSKGAGEEDFPLRARTKRIPSKGAVGGNPLRPALRKIPLRPRDRSSQRSTGVTRGQENALAHFLGGSPQ